MTCDELRPDYLPYALGVLDDPERSELRAHLARQCDQCLAGVREANRLAFALAGSVPALDPPRHLRGRVLAAAGIVPEPRWHWRTAWQAALATALAAFAVVLFQTNQTKVEMAALQQQVERSGMEASQLREAVSLLQSPDMREVHFGDGKPAPPRGRVFYDSSRVLLIASNLPAPPAGKTYEMWIIPKGGRPAPAGLFTSNTQGGALHMFRLPSGAVSGTDTVAVTLEAAAGADQPTTQPLIVVPL